jgi:hypothetical protein
VDNIKMDLGEIGWGRRAVHIEFWWKKIRRNEPL